jgi:hypothetical protein
MSAAPKVRQSDAVLDRHYFKRNVNMDFDLEKLKQEADEASEKKALLGVLGGSLQDVVSAPTAYELLKGRRSTAPDIKSGFDAAANAIKDPWEKQKKTYEMYKAAKENKDLERQQALAASEDDPNSTASKAARAFWQKRGIEIDPSDTASSLARRAGSMSDRGNIEARSQIDFDKAVKLEQLRQRGDIDKMNFQEKLGGEKKRFERMPEDQKELVTGLSKKNANKVAIASQIDSVTKILDDDSIGEDQKLMQARQLIKTLNSSEGQDAVGVEEAKRLAGMIEFRLFNLTEPGAVFGRDLKGFTEQAKTTSSALKDSITTNQGLINKTMGRGEGYQSPIDSFAKKETKKKVVGRKINPKTGEVKEIYDDGSSKIFPGQQVGASK